MSSDDADPSWKISVTAEGEATLALSGDYNDTLPGNGAEPFPVVADPENLELNRLQVSYMKGGNGVTLSHGPENTVLSAVHFFGCVFGGNGNDALSGFTAPKLLWVAKHEPDSWAQVRHILLPMVRPVLSIVLLLQIIWDLRVFTQIFVLQRAGGINRDTNLIGVYAYRSATGDNRFDLGATIAVASAGG